MKVKQSRKRWQVIIKLVKAGQLYLEQTEAVDPINDIKAGDEFIKELQTTVLRQVN